jgi:hypothetical protein
MPAKKIDLTDCIGFELPWTAQDSAALRAFLETGTGRRMLGRLILKRPAATERSDPFKRGIQSAIAEGYDEAVHTIGFLTDSSKSVKTSI